ncbi:hypothetical protein J6590_023068 [Homalodisca vitripennis]|nr:hypothetical protein J6590_023068 [Homalodisca vitripennis]
MRIILCIVSGALHARDYRTPSCISYGNGTHLTSLVINMLANQGSPDYCGVFVNNEERRDLLQQSMTSESSKVVISKLSIALYRLQTSSGISWKVI